ncbi:peptidylprolyl isomerase [Marivirga arenosa]|uniref:Peptidyl-prolyl cis-trans isomerase n=1 Tax=Marivirga arenosa TaxID=3059076 RepID=A0AA51N489_9BACT|nr:MULTISPECIES: peptidyl-prolyl cis-trans isomerase [unclassified Marivirga]WKK79054.1 peptidyl-prolyl cis-trans isomerase [Marivirga sp. BKB1-2]WMN05934.1 peptidyl-prolyl cis-trans isomerase [Marivirga sp. ABR2-2]
MKNNFLTISFIVLTSLLWSCEYINLKSFETEEKVEEVKVPVARVGNSVLYQKDLAGIVGNDISVKDSTNLIDRYVNSWIKKQLLISEASEKIDFDQASIERKVLDYRYALMVHEFKKYYVDNNLDTVVTNEEIETYFNDNKDNFELKQNIIRGYFITVSKDAPKINKLKSLINSDKPQDFKELKSYCFRFAETYFLEDSVWINFDEAIRNTPFTSVTNKIDFLKSNKFVEDENEEKIYFLRIKEFKISDQISPLEFVRNDIKQIILNKRKVALANQLEEEVFEKAKSSNKYEIYKAEK